MTPRADASYTRECMRFLLALAPAALLGLAAAAAEVPTVRLVPFEGALTPATAYRIEAAVDDADRERDTLVLVELDTPGGEKETMESVVKKMLAAKTPIVVWVGPSGARAASAGFFLLIASDVAAMAPGTRTGAASVVYGMGKSDEGDVLLKKINNDAAAFARSVAEHRGRNVAAAEEAVTSAASYTDAAAKDKGIVDLIAKDRDDLLRQLDGRVVKRFDGGTVTLRTTGARIVETEFGWTQGVKEFLATPVVAFFLLIVGLGGLYVEFTHPGLVLPGLAGAMSLVLFAFSARMLPVSAIGILLILLGVIMFVLEIKIASYGMLTVGGTVCLVLGSILLFPSSIPDLRVPLSVVLPASLTLAALCAVAVRLAVRAQRTPVQTGAEGLRGEVGTVAEALDPEGKVFVHGELWDAVSPSPCLPGSRVRVVAVHDMRLTVEPFGDGSAGGR